jgi:hypothetical protein
MTKNEKSDDKKNVSTRTRSPFGLFRSYVLRDGKD